MLKSSVFTKWMASPNFPAVLWDSWERNDKSHISKALRPSFTTQIKIPFSFQQLRFSPPHQKPPICPQFLLLPRRDISMTRKKFPQSNLIETKPHFDFFIWSVDTSGPWANTCPSYRTGKTFSHLWSSNYSCFLNGNSTHCDVTAFWPICMIWCQKACILLLYAKKHAY